MSRNPDRPPTVWRTLGILTGWVLTAIGAGFASLYAVPELQLLNRRLAIVAAFIPYGIFAWVGAIILFATFGRGWGKTVALLVAPGLVVQLIWASSYLPNHSPTPQNVGTSVFTFNSRCNPTGKEQLAEKLQTIQPDLIVIQGSTDNLKEHLTQAGLEKTHPHQVFFPMPDLATCGTEIYSKTPITPHPHSTPEQPAVRIPLNDTNIVLLPVDSYGPQYGLTAWATTLTTLGRSAQTAISEGFPVVIAGDFNAVREHQPFRHLLSKHNLVDAAADSKSGWLPTFPANHKYPPLIQIDHVIVSPNIKTNTVETVQISHTQAHRAIIAWLDVKHPPNR